METTQAAPVVQQTVISSPTRGRLILSALRYLAGKAATILATIFVGVFITILIVNYPATRGSPTAKSPFELKLESDIYQTVRGNIYSGTFPYDPSMGSTFEAQVAGYSAILREQVGLNLPYLPRNLLWTLKSLTFDWGELNTFYSLQFGSIGQVPDTGENIVLLHLPNTLLLVGTAYLLVFLLGLPLALYLARHHGSRLDRVVTILSPISSVPSWVFAILLVAFFAVQLRWFPVTGMFDIFRRPETPWQYVETIGRHMVLPVSALVLSLLFQLIYAWRTFFIIYSEEDYVELARAKGLSSRILEKQYILKPALPYIITSFTTSLIGFWQLTVALERVFEWPGIGLLYIQVLPNYWGERIAIGDLMVVIQIVVIFAYLLGILVFILDLVYVIVDPRIHLIPSSSLNERQARVKQARAWRASLTGSGEAGYGSGAADLFPLPQLARRARVPARCESTLPAVPPGAAHVSLRHLWSGGDLHPVCRLAVCGAGAPIRGVWARIR
jgi:peptide/nickel transport system permease protein